MDFADKVYKLLPEIPHGRVATYGQIAALISTPRAARMVGAALRQLPANSKLPWWRVINSSGMISIENLGVPKTEQARRLQAESVAVKLKDGSYFVDLKKYLWKMRV